MKNKITIWTKGIDSSGMSTWIQISDQWYIVDFGVKFNIPEKSINLLTHHHCDHDRFLPKNYIFPEKLEPIDEHILYHQIPHGNIPTYSYIIDKQVLILTDCKNCHKVWDTSLTDLKVIIIECNRDSDLPKLKHSITAREHLGHKDVIWFLENRDILRDTTIILTHISKDNMTKSALNMIKAYCAQKELDLIIAEKNKIYEI